MKDMPAKYGAPLSDAPHEHQADTTSTSAVARVDAVGYSFPYSCSPGARRKSRRGSTDFDREFPIEGLQ